MFHGKPSVAASSSSTGVEGWLTPVHDCVQIKSQTGMHLAGPKSKDLLHTASHAAA